MELSGRIWLWYPRPIPSQQTATGSETDSYDGIVHQTGRIESFYPFGTLCQAIVWFMLLAAPDSGFERQNLEGMSANRIDRGPQLDDFLSGSHESHLLPGIYWSVRCQ